MEVEASHRSALELSAIREEPPAEAMVATVPQDPAPAVAIKSQQALPALSNPDKLPYMDCTATREEARMPGSPEAGLNKAVAADDSLVRVRKQKLSTNAGIYCKI